MPSKLRTNAEVDHSVILVIPTLECRSYLLETLLSLRASLHCFDQVILSVNGLSRGKAEQIAVQSGLLPSSNNQLFCTGRALTARQHLRYICRKLHKYAAPQDLIILFADDDLLPFGVDLASYIEAVRKDRGSCIGMGNFSSFHSKDAQVSFRPTHVEPGETIDPLEFLARNKEGHRFTNISSMMIPYPIFKEACSFMWYLGSAGRRFEYILATHKDVSSLYSPLNTSALIRQHSLQAGVTLSYESYLHDELVYILWAWLNQPLTRPWSSEVVFADFSLSRFRILFHSLFNLKLERKAPVLDASLKRIALLCRRIPFLKMLKRFADKCFFSKS